MEIKSPSFVEQLELTEQLEEGGLPPWLCALINYLVKPLVLIGALRVPINSEIHWEKREQG